MPKYKVTLDTKDKTTKECQCQSFQALNIWIENIFHIQIKNIKYKKPRIKDQLTFQKEVKDGIELLILGNLQKLKTPQELEMQKKQMEQIQKFRIQTKMNPHQKILKKLDQLGIKERGIEHFNLQTNQSQDLGIQYALCPLHLLKIIPEFKRYCYNYQIVQKNPDGLIIEELAAIFLQLEKGQGVVCPLEWISAWITYCADDIQFPFPTYDIDYFLNKTFNTIKSAFEFELQQPDSRVNIISKLFGIEMLTKQMDITKFDMEQTEPQKQIDKKVIKHFLQCDLSKSQLNTLHSGIKQRFKKKTLWKVFYAFDIEYSEKITYIYHLPKYLFVHLNRFGYPAAKEEGSRVDLLENKKSYHKVSYGRIIDFYDFCDPNLQAKLNAGKYQKHQMFYHYQSDQRFAVFKKEIPNIQEMSDAEIKYRFFDKILYDREIFHNFFFEPIKDSKPTGEYRLIGIVLHKGDYYHHPDPSHLHDCKGDFMTLVYFKDRKWIKYRRAEVSYIDVDQAINEKYWGKEGGSWTPVLFLYRQIYMKNMQIEYNKQKKMKKLQKLEISES